MDFVNELLERLKNPVVAAVAALVAGFIFGLVWGWVIQPVEFVDATPEVLRADYQKDYLRMTIDSFLVNSDTTKALQRWQNLGDSARPLLQELSANPETQDKAAIDGFAQIIDAAGPAETTEGEQPAAEGEAQAEGETDASGSMSPMLRYGLIFVGLVVVGVVAFLALRVLRPLSSGGDEDNPVRQSMQHSRSIEKTDYEEMGLATPITQSMTTYVVGDDLYDESFSIESQAGEFLGEYGVGISDTIGVGDPKKVTALEIWLFDKNDIKTATKVLMSEHAYNNPEIVQRLEAKGELVVVRPESPVKLETETLQLLVTAADLAYGSGHLPPNSYFDRVTLELAVWPKQSPPSDAAG